MYEERCQWTEQLKDIATVDRFNFEGMAMADGKSVKDLNELLKIGRDSYRRNAKLINVVMRFEHPRLAREPINERDIRPRAIKAECRRLCRYPDAQIVMISFLRRWL